MSYPMYDLVNSVTTADVWSSSDGGQLENVITASVNDPKYNLATLSLCA